MVIFKIIIIIIEFVIIIIFNFIY